MNSRLKLARVAPTTSEWRVGALSDRLVFQTPEWLAFIAESQRATPILARIDEGRETVGFFTGLMVRRFGLKILGSPMKGWTTQYMGFNLFDESLRAEALRALQTFAFQELGCVHVELRDRFMTRSDVAMSKVPCEISETPVLESDLSPSEEELLRRMDSDRRRCIRIAAKDGVTVEEANEEGFAEEYIAQLKEVFAKHNIVPAFGVGRVQALIRHLLPTGNLLLLRVRAPDGSCIATGIFPGLGTTAYFWGGASSRSGLKHHPNESMLWYAMRWWRDRGITSFDFGGGGSYKLKYGPAVSSVPTILMSRTRAIPLLRDAGIKAVRARQKTNAMLRRLIR